MQGMHDIFSRYFIPLMKIGIKEKRITPIDLAIYISNLLNIVITFFVFVIVSIIALNVS
jgi:hypothetical protein